MIRNLFSKYSIRDFIAFYRKKLNEEIDKMEITEESDMQVIIEQLINRATIEPIVFHEPQPSEPIETTRKRKSMRGNMYDQKVYQIDITIPFDGNKDLFDCHPSGLSTVVYLDRRATINNANVKIEITLEELDSVRFNSEVNGILDQLKTNLPAIHLDIKPWNDGLEDYISETLEKRKGVVAEKHNFMQEIGLSVNSKSDKFLVPSPVTKRKIPKPKVSPKKDGRKELTPVLIEKVYADIKEVIFNAGQAIERKPSLYLGKYEEDLRDFFLLFLETRYESTTGVGEAFNKKGKTDILLKYAKDGSNLFVAECKFWRGQKNFMKAIDQLLSYLTHRDSKTALMIFVDQKELSNVISTAKNEIEAHECFKRFKGESYHTSFAYEMCLPDDSNLIIRMELMFFHFPKNL